MPDNTNTNFDAIWASKLTTGVLVDHIKSVASDVRRFGPEQRAELLREAARRLDEFATQQILVTLNDGRQVAVMNGGVQVRSSTSGTWSLPINTSTTPHQPGTYYLGEW